MPEPHRGPQRPIHHSSSSHAKPQTPFFTRRCGRHAHHHFCSGWSYLFCAPMVPMTRHEYRRSVLGHSPKRLSGWRWLLFALCLPALPLIFLGDILSAPFGARRHESTAHWLVYMMAQGLTPQEHSRTNNLGSGRDQSWSPSPRWWRWQCSEIPRQRGEGWVLWPAMLLRDAAPPCRHELPAGFPQFVGAAWEESPRISPTRPDKAQIGVA